MFALLGPLALSLLTQTGGALPTKDHTVDVGDLPAVLKRKTLRVLVPGADEQLLPRRGRPEAVDRELAAEFAKELGVAVEFVVVPRFDLLLPMLKEGLGDVVAAQLTATEERRGQVAFSVPILTVSEVVVGKRGATGLPTRPEELAAHEVHVRPDSSYHATLRGLASPPKLVAAAETLDEEELVYQVTRGEIPLTVVDSHLLAAIAAYNPDAAALFPIAKDRPIGWAVRKDNPRLLERVDRFVARSAKARYAVESARGDLAEIKARGVLRVLTRNNAMSYYLDHGQPSGFEYELCRALADRLGVELEMVVAPSRDQLIPWLLDGHGDVIAASLTQTPEREELIAFSRPYLTVQEVVVKKRGQLPEVTAVEHLAGRTVHVRGSSSYHQSLLRLKATHPTIGIALAPETLETEQLIDQVGTAQIPLTIADSHILDLELAHRDDVEAAFTLPSDAPRAIALGLRRSDRQLKELLDRTIAQLADKHGNFRPKARVRRPDAFTPAQAGQLSPHDDLLRRLGGEVGIDWRLLAAIAYEESGFDPAGGGGGVGLFRVRPSTARQLGFAKLDSVEASAEAGARQLAALAQRFDPKIPHKQRLRFAMAAYHVGIGHVLDAQRLAKELGLRDDKWFGNVERAMRLLSEPEHARRARFGFCRGEEPIGYVSRIETRYLGYQRVLRR